MSNEGTSNSPLTAVIQVQISSEAPNKSTTYAVSLRVMLNKCSNAIDTARMLKPGPRFHTIGSIGGLARLLM